MTNRGTKWLQALTKNSNCDQSFPQSVQVIDTEFNSSPVRFINIAIDAKNKFVRASNGEVGLLEGWWLAKAVQQVIDMDKGDTRKRPIIAIIDVPSQAYGRREEAYGIHLALAAATNAYASARLEGHPVIGVIVGKAMSGGFLAHGYQANRLIALDDSGCMVHAMGKASAARITMRSMDELEALTKSIPPMAYDIQNFQKLGLLYELVNVKSADLPEEKDVQIVMESLERAIKDIDSIDLTCRLGATARMASTRVRQKMEQCWY